MSASPVAVATGELQSVNPATLEVVGAVRVTAAEEVQEAVAEARLAQEAWSSTAPDRRRRLLAAASQVVLERMDEIAATLTAETGKPLVEAYTTELFPAVENACWLARNAGRILRPERLPTPQLFLKHKRGWTLYEPLGVVAIISPWNFPFGIGFSQAAAAVSAGNAVVAKPSELTPLSGAWVERVFTEAGAPPGLVRVVQGEGESTGAALVKARGVARVVFTGSTATGRKVAAESGSRLRPVTLELGGKDPMLVFADADLERAIEGAAWGSFANCGQVCSGVERILVERSRYPEFVDRLESRARSLSIGRGDDLTTELGPLISEAQRTRVEELVGAAAADGVELRAGGRRPEVGLPGWFYEPTVLAGERIRGRVAQEELFGPVVTVEPFDGEDEAVRRANDSAYGLGASVWTRDRDRARRIATRLEAGSVWTNDHAYSYFAGQAPWGGYKDSGFGRTHSRHGLYELSQVKFVGTDSGRVPVPWWFPYDRSTPAGFQAALAVLYGEGLGAKAAAAWRHRGGLVSLARRYRPR